MKDFVRAYFEAFVNRRNAGVIRRNMTTDFYDHDGPGGKPAGVDTDEKGMEGMYEIMPDLQLTIEEMVAEVDRVCRNIWRADLRAVGYRDGAWRRRRFELVTLSLQNKGAQVPPFVLALHADHRAR